MATYDELHADLDAGTHNGGALYDDSGPAETDTPEVDHLDGLHDDESDTGCSLCLALFDTTGSEWEGGKNA